MTLQAHWFSYTAPIGPREPPKKSIYILLHPIQLSGPPVHSEYIEFCWAPQLLFTKAKICTLPLDYIT